MVEYYFGDRPVVEIVRNGIVLYSRSTTPTALPAEMSMEVGTATGAVTQGTALPAEMSMEVGTAAGAVTQGTALPVEMSMEVGTATVDTSGLVIADNDDGTSTITSFGPAPFAITDNDDGTSTITEGIAA